jgi:ABC-2 type transport system ATP-binding protein
MQKKTLLVSVLIRDPEVLFLDEPTAGLDPRSANTVKQILTDLCLNGRTVFMATHILEIAEKICDRIGIIYQGKLIAVGTLAELRNQIANASLEEIFLQLTSGTLSYNA